MIKDIGVDIYIYILDKYIDEVDWTIDDRQIFLFKRISSAEKNT